MPELIQSSQNIIDLSNLFLKASQLCSNINIGFSSFYIDNNNSGINKLARTLREIFISSLLGSQNAFLLLSQTFDPSYKPIPLTIDTLGIAFYQVYKAFENIGSAFNEMGSQNYKNLPQYSTAAYNQAANQFQSIIAPDQQATVALNIIISNFNLLSNTLSNAASIIQIINIVNNNDILVKAIIAASKASQGLSIAFTTFYKDYYLVSTIDLANTNTEVFGPNFYTISISFQQAYLMCSYLSNFPILQQKSLTSDAFNNISNIFFDISNLFININNSPFDLIPSGLQDVLLIAYYQLGLSFNYLSNSNTNTELFNGLFYNSYIDKIIINIYDQIIYDLTYLSFSTPVYTYDIVNKISEYLKNISSNLSIIIDNIDIQPINSITLLKSTFSLIKNKFDNLSLAFLKEIKTHDDLLSYFTNINIYNTQIYNEFSLSYSTVKYIALEPLITYPISYNKILFSKISTYFSKISQDFLILNNIDLANSFSILSLIFNNSDPLYIILYQIYNCCIFISSILSTSNFDVISHSITQNISINFNNLGVVFKLIGESITNSNKSSDTIYILSSSFDLISNISIDLSNIFNINNSALITYLDIAFKQYVKIFNIAYVSSYLSTNTSKISSSFSSSLSSISNACNNISNSYSSLNFISDSILNFDFNVLEYKILSYLFKIASNSSSQNDLINVFQHIYSIVDNEILYSSSNEVVSVISIKNLFPNNNKTLFAINNLVSNYNIFASSLDSAASAVNILPFNIDNPINFSVALLSASYSIYEIAYTYSILGASLSLSSSDLTNQLSIINLSILDFNASINQVYKSITYIPPKTFTSI